MEMAASHGILKYGFGKLKLHRKINEVKGMVRRIRVAFLK